MTDYEVRPVTYLTMRFSVPAFVEIPGIAAIRRWWLYETELDCELEEWEDRANGD